MLKNFIRLNSIDSTNNFASDLISKNQAPELTIITSNFQTDGRGQQANVWLSEVSKNITLSFVVEPTFMNIDAQFNLNIATTLAITDFIIELLGEAYKKKVKIKWPNDIYYNNSKLGGVLIENTLIGNKFANAIIGIGLNINQDKFSEKLSNPISLINITGSTYNCTDLIDNLTNCFEKRYLELKQNTITNHKAIYLNRLLNYQLCKPYNIKGKIIDASIVDVDSYGKIILSDVLNNLHVCDFKEIAYIFN